MSQNQDQLVNDDEFGGAEQVQQFLTFELSQKIYGIGILHIREIMEYGNLTVVPLMPEFIAGVINLRGNVVPVVDLARRFEHPPSPIGKRTSIIIVDVNGLDEQNVEVGIIVDLVNEVIELNHSDIAATPAFGANIRADFIEGMGRVDGHLMILLDVNHVLSINELSALTSIAEGPAVSSNAQTTSAQI